MRSELHDAIWAANGRRIRIALIGAAIGVVATITGLTLIASM